MFSLFSFPFRRLFRRKQRREDARAPREHGMMMEVTVGGCGAVHIFRCAPAIYDDCISPRAAVDGHDSRRMRAMGPGL